MGKVIITHDEKCKSCEGTGLYVGMGERNGSAVVCHACKGTGCFKFRHEYDEFTERKDKKGVVRVFATNPGICIGTGNGHRLEDFGGMTFNDWKAGKKFVAGTENRNYTCPCWWYQSANYELKPDWSRCNIDGSFSSCRHFDNKAECWKKWDKEQK